MDLTFAGELINIIPFFALAILASQRVAILDYYSSSQGYYRDPEKVQLIVNPSESQRPYLQDSAHSLGSAFECEKDVARTRVQGVGREY